MLPALLALIAAEFVAAAGTVVAYRRRLRLAVFVDTIGEIDELVSTAVVAARRAQGRELSVAQRAALLEETRASLEQAAAIMRATPIPLELALGRSLPALVEAKPQA